MKSVVIFDTGTGGRLFAEYFQLNYPDVAVEVVIDDENAPYGDKSNSDIFYLTEATIGKYIGKVDAIVLACNTATAVAIDRLRAKYPSQIFIGFEPMIKTGAKLTQTGKIAVLATSATKKSDRYKALKSRFPEITVIEPNCDTWATKIDSGNLSQNDIKNALDGQLDGVDVIILACTHYVAVVDQIQRIAGPKIRVIYPFAAVSNYIIKLLGIIKTGINDAKTDN
ncbi:glutamate racemase [Alphaproteobacteria bacterium]|nr:glutamate racemase [Alphaproteobacteria bacterium]